ncbi:glycosyltransferase family 4 protein [Chloroflexus sp.]|uniref:glycosyltransferase family 4 protein n=1 Tax=Chloroflexus sp. TaxID=1904827 RepID=UPI00261C9FD9|nr:glycosyltransferase family 1 protein [uncultured Chloroflexus sp.]
MRIGIDFTAGIWQGAGIGRYTRELVRAAAQAGPDLSFHLFYAAGGLDPTSPFVRYAHDLAASYPHITLRPLPINPRLLTIIWQRLRLPLRIEWFIGSLDVVHAPDFVLPPTHARALLTIHDLTFLVEPGCAEPNLRRYLSEAVPRSLRRADLILVDSKATAGDLGRLYGIPNQRIRLLYPAVDERFRPISPAELLMVRERLRLPDHYLLFVGTLEPRKNLVRLLHAFATLRDDYPDLYLLIAGRRGWLYDEIFTTVEQHRLGDRVHFLDFVADDDLPALYNLAEAFVYPSLYEGFGFPVLEALACGTPVVTSRVASLPEVAGSAAIMVDPLDTEDIAAGIRAALTDPTPLRAAGPPQAATFRWEQTGQALVTIYRELAATTAAT